MSVLTQYNQCLNWIIYTVKEIKGLEFKEVFVINQGMNDNEEYIAYTRALIKLNVINRLPGISSI